jgi:signal transduction histidine kinase
MLRHIQERRDRFLLVLAAVALLGFVVVSLLSVATRIGHLTPGFVTWQNLVVPAVSTTGDGDSAAAVPLRSLLEAIDGVPVRDAAALRERIGTKPAGHEFAYTFRHHDERVTVTLPTRTLRWAEVLPFVAPFLLNGLVLGITALIVFFFRPRLPAARAFLALGLTFGGMVVLAIDAFSSFWLHRLCFALDSLVPAALLHFALCFPEERDIVRRRPQLKWQIYAPFAVLALLQNYFLTRSAEAHLAVSDLVYAADAAAALFAVASLVQTFRSSANAVARQQAKAVAAGFAIASFVPAIAILNVVLLDAHIPFNPLTIFLLVCPISIGYAIARHNLFEVDRFLRLGVVYGALSLVVFATYAGLVVAGEMLVGSGQPLPAEIGAFYIVVVLLVANPLRERVQTAVDRLFYRQTYSYRGTVVETSRRLASLLGTRQITESVLHVLTDVMTIGSGAVFALRGEDSVEAHGKPAGTDATARELSTDSAAAIRSLAARRGPVTAYEIESRRQDGDARAVAEADAAQALDAVLFVPLRFQDHPVGLLCVGEKLSGAFYSDEDVHLLQTLANQAALALENARAYEALAQAQASLVEAERLAAVGELAATVAHGIRNPLAGIRMAAQIAQEDRDDAATVDDSLTDIISETDRLEKRVRALLDITRPAVFAPAATDLGPWVTAFAAETRAHLPQGVELTTRIAADPATVAIDPPQLHEVLEVLVNNAAEAMQGTGKVAITVAPGDRGVKIAVADDGPGISPQVLGRIFDLFFTTKTSGTGVGLAMAKRLVERQGGTLSATSEPGRGTTFTIELPRAAQPAATGTAG